MAKDDKVKDVKDVREPGVYMTLFGNAALVDDWTADTAYDLDAAENIPIEFVDETKFIRSDLG